MARCINDFSNMRDAELVNKALRVAEGMTGNPGYPDPPVKMEALNAETQQYSDALVLSKGRDTVKVAIKNKQRKTLIVTLSQLLGYVNIAANGDIPTLLSSGFTLGKAADDYELGEVEKVRLIHGQNSGEVLVRYSKPAGAILYQIEFALSPVENDKWDEKRTNYLKLLLTGLIRGKEYAIRVRAIGRDGIETVSAVMTILVV